MTRDDANDPDDVLEPADLELDDERVTELGEDRYIIETGGDGERRDSSTPSVPTGSEAPRTVDRSETASSASRSDFASVPETYAIDLTIKTEYGVEHFEHRSDDVREQFEALLYWYANQLDAERAPEEVLRVLFDATDVP